MEQYVLGLVLWSNNFFLLPLNSLYLFMNSVDFEKIETLQMIDRFFFF